MKTGVALFSAPGVLIDVFTAWWVQEGRTEGVGCGLINCCSTLLHMARRSSMTLLGCVLPVVLAATVAERQGCDASLLSRRAMQVAMQVAKVCGMDFMTLMNSHACLLIIT